MSMLKSGFAAIALITTLAASSVVPAQAASTLSFGQRDRVVAAYCDKYSRDRDCVDYRQGRWNESHYNRFYRSHRSNLDSISSGLFGFGFAAILGGAIANSLPKDRVVGYSDDDHVAACQDRYRSYSERTDTYLGNDGRRHTCNL